MQRFYQDLICHEWCGSKTCRPTASFVQRDTFLERIPPASSNQPALQTLIDLVFLLSSVPFLLLLLHTKNIIRSRTSSYTCWHARVRGMENGKTGEINEFTRSTAWLGYGYGYGYGLRIVMGYHGMSTALEFWRGRLRHQGIRHQGLKGIGHCDGLSNCWIGVPWALG